MFCYNCGKQLQDGINYCPYCGTQISAVPDHNKPDDPEKSKREAAINEIHHLLNYFSQKTAQYNEYDSVTSVIYKLRLGRNKILKTLSIVLFIFGGILLLLSVFMIFKTNFLSSNIHTLGALAGGTIWLMWFVFCFSFLAAATALLIVDSFKKNRFFQKLKIYVNRYYELSDELYINYLNYKDCPIDAHLTNPSNILVVQKTIMLGQADSIENAISILSKSAVNNSVEKYSRACAEYAQKMAISFGRTEEASKLNAVFLPGNYFLIK